MTTLQLKVATATADLKSVTAAARMLKISQPNASSCLKLLEDEIGFPIFIRTSSGVSVTAKGARFLDHARSILDENEKIMSIKDEENVFRLHLGTVNYYASAEPFFTLCQKHRDDVKLDVSYSSVPVSEGIERLIRRSLDVVAVPVMKHQISGLVVQCRESGIAMTSICQIPSIMMMRKDHPMANDPRCLSIAQGCDTMKDYPYVGLRLLNEDLSSTRYNDSDFIQCSSKIFVDDTNVRLAMIESTNGFGFGLLSSYRMMSQFGLISFPVPGVSLELFCLSLSGNEQRKELKEYIDLLKEEMNGLLGHLQYV